MLKFVKNFQNSKRLFENTKSFLSKRLKSLREMKMLIKNFKLFKILMGGLDWFWKEYQIYETKNLKLIFKNDSKNLLNFQLLNRVLKN